MGRSRGGSRAKAPRPSASGTPARAVQTKQILGSAPAWGPDSPDLRTGPGEPRLRYSASASRARPRGGVDPRPCPSIMACLQVLERKEEASQALPLGRSIKFRPLGRDRSSTPPLCLGLKVPKGGGVQAPPLGDGPPLLNGGGVQAPPLWA